MRPIAGKPAHITKHDSLVRRGSVGAALCCEEAGTDKASLLLVPASSQHKAAPTVSHEKRSMSSPCKPFPTDPSVESRRTLPAASPSRRQAAPQAPCGWEPCSPRPAPENQCLGLIGRPHEGTPACDEKSTNRRMARSYTR
ncbi:hypothetical protein CXG50_17125 [Pseudomonas plecoglossicida]|nr:hypothetical protein CSW00_06500 [Pseudomonas sp. MR 02]PLU96992.1 hypothetical protein CXG52_16780 [Pseudomonas plecoglossicida]PLV07599.1 hypothetical protein CXG50_17125 [Pseudomonas plecoglossicida]